MKSTIKGFRLGKGLTQKQIAQQVGITTNNYQRIEYGETRPKLSTAIKIADALGVTDLRELWALNNKPLSS